MKTIGIVGGGQLGKMMILEGKKLGLHFIVLDPTPHCPAASIADEHIVGNFYSEVALKELAEKSDVITYEFEHIDADRLIKLELEGHTVYPSPHTLKMIQNKLRQKDFLRRHHIPIPAFEAIYAQKEILDKIEVYGLPLVLKNTTNGYDGKGNYVIKKLQDIPIAYEALKGEKYQLMVEEFIPFQKEVSAIIAIGEDGESAIYPLGENTHEESILKTTTVPASISAACEEKVKEIAFKTMEILKGPGIFCIEMFVDEEENVLVNEIAPRPHNSGHYTIEACSTSQFQQHIRAILGLPLGEVNLLKPTMMINLLGEMGYTGKTKVVGLEEALSIPEVHVHLYGKTTTMPQRKMGHVTILDDQAELVLQKAEKVKKILKIIGD